MEIREVVRLPNLLSLSRIALAPVAGYFLWRPEAWAAWAALATVALAGITDGLDGYLARRRNRVTPLGTVLDPIADKTFAVILVVGLLLFRDFPLWLAATIVARDLLIAGGGVYLMRRQTGLSLPSNLTGKWAFAALVVLLGACIIRFEFSMKLMTPVVTVLLVASLINYARAFVATASGRKVMPFTDRAAYRLARGILAALVILAHLVMFWIEFLS